MRYLDEAGALHRLTPVWDASAPQPRLLPKPDGGTIELPDPAGGPHPPARPGGFSGPFQWPVTEDPGRPGVNPLPHAPPLDPDDPCFDLPSEDCFNDPGAPQAPTDFTLPSDDGTSLRADYFAAEDVWIVSVPDGTRWGRDMASSPGARARILSSVRGFPLAMGRPAA